MISWENLPTRETIKDTIEYAEFDLYFDEAVSHGVDVKTAGLIAGYIITGEVEFGETVYCEELE